MIIALIALLLPPSTHALSNSRIKSVGGGLAVVPPGNFGLFDPNAEGKLQGTGTLKERLQQGPQFSPSALSDESATPQFSLLDCQDWLEYLDADGNVPLNFAKPQQPIQATVLARTRIIDEGAPGDIQHVIMKLPEGFHYVEGQSLSVIPPSPQGEKNHKPRLYSIASTRYGDILDGTTVSLCVRRAEYTDPITGQIDPAKAGVCSSFLCNASPGDSVAVAGPVGKTMCLPQDPTTDIIMVATGTGIAPFRAFLHRLFMETTVTRHMYQGQAWLILGVPTTGGLLYPQEFSAMQQNGACVHFVYMVSPCIPCISHYLLYVSIALPGQLAIDYAISREMTNDEGGKLYVQHVLSQKADVLFEKLDRGAHIFFCGLKGMMPGILEALESVSTKRGVDWNSKLKELKANGQWHVEVY
jgi:ferredoxin--NADP+ reductase